MRVAQSADTLPRQSRWQCRAVGGTLDLRGLFARGGHGSGERTLLSGNSLAHTNQYVCERFAQVLPELGECGAQLAGYAIITA